MTLPIDHLQAPESALRHLDPRWKLAALVLAAVAVALLRCLLPSVLALVGAVLLAGLGRLPLRWYFTRVGGLALFLALFALLLPLLPQEQGPVWQVGPVPVYLYGLAAAARLCLKALAILTLMLVLLATTPPNDTLKAAHVLYVPGFFIQLILLTYRYLFLLAEELGRLRIALRVRGYRNRPNLHSYRTVGHVAGILLVRSHERAERVGQAMRCRGFDGRFRSLAVFHTRAADVVFFLLTAAPAAGLLAWDLWQR